MLYPLDRRAADREEAAGLWPLFYAFITVPRPVRDAVYDGIARNRYRWFGRMESCRIPTPALSGRFLAR